jgi:glutathione S-transferase
MRLYTFHISHFSEKARFALDLSGLPYEEKQLLPGAHMLATRRRAKATSVPVLEIDPKNVVQGSSAILDALESRLGFGALAVADAERSRAIELEALADRAFGRGLQTIFYSVLLDTPGAVADLWMQRGPRWGRAFYAVMMPFIGAALRRSYRANAKDAAAAREAFVRAFDETDRALEGRSYFFGETLSRVDVTVAALVAPVVQPKEHPFEWPDAQPPELVAFARSLEGRPTWDHVLRVYREQRGSMIQHRSLP